MDRKETTHVEEEISRRDLHDHVPFAHSATANDLYAVLRQPQFLEIEGQFEKYPQIRIRMTNEQKALDEQLKCVKHMLPIVWGTRECNAVPASVGLQHAATFCIPESIASAHLNQSHRYRDGYLSSRISMAAQQVQQAVLEPFTPFSMMTTLWEMHLSKQESADIGRFSSLSQHGIPHAFMNYAVYETMRAAECIAHKSGRSLSLEEEEMHYQYFAMILYCAGFRTPPDRAEMEQYAEAIDGLARTTPMTRELLNRLVYTETQWNKLSNAEESTSETTTAAFPIHEFLRPNSQRVFHEVFSQ